MNLEAGHEVAIFLFAGGASLGLSCALAFLLVVLGERQKGILYPIYAAIGLVFFLVLGIFVEAPRWTLLLALLGLVVGYWLGVLLMVGRLREYVRQVRDRQQRRR